MRRMHLSMIEAAAEVVVEVERLALKRKETK